MTLSGADCRDCFGVDFVLFILLADIASSVDSAAAPPRIGLQIPEEGRPPATQPLQNIPRHKHCHNVAPSSTHHMAGSYSDIEIINKGYFQQKQYTDYTCVIHYLSYMFCAIN